MTTEFEELVAKMGKIWVPCKNPPDVGDVPLDAGRMSSTELAEWLGKTTAWYSYAQMQLGLTEARKALLQKRFHRLVNEEIVSAQLKERTYELQIAGALHNNPTLRPLQVEIAELEAQSEIWNRATRAYEAYLNLFREEGNRRRWDKA